MFGQPCYQVPFNPFSTGASFQEAFSSHRLSAGTVRFRISEQPRPRAPLGVKTPAIQWVIVFQKSSSQIFSLSYIRLLSGATDQNVREKLTHRIRTYDSPRRINSRPLYSPWRKPLRITDGRSASKSANRYLPEAAKLRAGARFSRPDPPRSDKFFGPRCDQDRLQIGWGRVSVRACWNDRISRRLRLPRPLRNDIGLDPALSVYRAAAECAPSKEILGHASNRWGPEE